MGRGEEKIIVFNDRWGRLPVLFFSEKRIFALSRELKFVFHWIPSIEFDSIAIAEFLMY